MHYAKGDGTVISRFGYGYDAMGNPLTMAEANGDVVSWTYDALYELTREQRNGTNNYDVTFTYDAAGNRLTRLASGATTTYTYDAANELLAEQTGATITTYSYDASGNLTVKNVAGALTTYTWDGENRMVVVGLQDGSLTTLTYDATGLRRKSQAGAATTNFVLDGQDVLLETDGGGTTQAAYTQGRGTYGPLIAQRRGGAIIFHHFDALGSTTELTSAAAAVTDTYRYYAFGETRASTGSTTNPFGFVGRLGYYNEPSLALQYLRARWYQPAAGRFISRDRARPVLRLPLTLDRYAYVRNWTVRAADPSGRDVYVPGYPPQPIQPGDPGPGYPLWPWPPVKEPPAPPPTGYYSAPCPATAPFQMPPGLPPDYPTLPPTPLPWAKLPQKYWPIYKNYWPTFWPCYVGSDPTHCFACCTHRNLESEEELACIAGCNHLGSYPVEPVHQPGEGGPIYVPGPGGRWPERIQPPPAETLPPGTGLLPGGPYSPRL